MFVLLVTYQKGLDEVDKYLDAHREYLDRFYQSGHFLVSGRQNPRVGGVILCKASDKKEVEQIISHDPFLIQQIAQYQIIEVDVTRCLPELASVLA